MLIWYANTEERMCSSIIKNLDVIVSVGEKAVIEKYKFQVDRNRSLLSLLLQKAIIRQQFQLSDDEFVIKRTGEVFKFPIYNFLRNT